MFDEDRGADSPAALLCGNRLATLIAFSCAWSSLGLCRGGIKAPSGHRGYVPSLKCVASVQSPHTSSTDCKSSLGSLPHRACKRWVKSFFTSCLGRKEKSESLFSAWSHFIICVLAYMCDWDRMSAQFQSRVTRGRWPDGQMKEACVATRKLHRGGMGMVRCWCAARGEARAVQHLGLFVLLSWNASDRIHFKYTTALVHGSRGRSLRPKSSIGEARGSRVARKGGKGGSNASTVRSLISEGRTHMALSPPTGPTCHSLTHGLRGMDSNYRG